MSVPMSPVTGEAPTSLYRYFDRVGLLIYVGITKRGHQRNTEHNMRAEWWPYAARQEVEHLPTRTAALRREAELIRQFRPPFNKQHNDRSDTARSDYLALSQFYDSSPRQVLEQFGRAIPLLPMKPGTPVYYTPPEFGSVVSLLDIPVGLQVRTPAKWTVVLSVEDHGPVKVLRLGRPLPNGMMAFARVQFVSQKPEAFGVKQIQAGPAAAMPGLVRLLVDAVTP